LSSLWEEIKRRNVVRVAVTYTVVAWLLAQVADFAIETFGAPAWALQIFVVFLLLGLPLAVLLAWAFDLTPGGIRRTGSGEGENEQPQRQTRTVFIVFIIIAASFAAWLQFFGPDSLGLKPDTVGRTRPAAAANGDSQHFDLAFPEDAPLALIGAVELGNGKQAFAISPNGRFVAYVGASSDGYQLYLRDLSSNTTAPFDGTHNASSPFFAPNSMWIGYFVGNELFKIGVNGGEPLLVDEATNSAGAYWTSSDDIVMAIEEGDLMARVPASGGKVEVIDTGVGLRFPTAVRDRNKAIVYGRVLDLESLELEPLPIQSPDVRYANGYLLYVLQDSLVAARYDVDNNVLESKPVPVITGLQVEISGVGQWSLSDNGTLLYMPGRDAGSNPLHWASSTGTETLDLPIRNRGTMEISPDGIRLAIPESRATTTDVWIYELASGRATKLTTDGISSGPMFWSPDGASVFYQKNAGPTEITYRKYIGSQLAEESVLENKGDVYTATSISADGLLMGLQGGKDAVGIGIYDVSAKKVTPVSSASKEDWGTAISPDGRAIAYTSSSSGAYNIYIQPVPATGRLYQVSRQGGSEEPRWSADGSKVYYRSNSRIMMADVTTEPEIKIGEPEVFYAGTFENVGGRSYAVHPDGERALVIHSENLSSSIRVVTNWFTKVERLIQESEAETH
jgi:Tol biopolymer transport system component